VQLLTKYGLRWDSTEGKHHFDWKDDEFGKKNIYRNARKKSIIKECKDSLRRLQTDYIGPPIITSKSKSDISGNVHSLSKNLVLVIGNSFRLAQLSIVPGPKKDARCKICIFLFMKNYLIVFPTCKQIQSFCRYFYIIVGL
jgi:hypothetical protein